MKSIELTQQFLKDKFDQSSYLNEHLKEKAYRLEHSYRVANIGSQIALKEGLDKEAMIIACLLHDIAYCETFNKDEHINHGRVSARISRPFLETLELTPKQINDICYGIAIHVDDKADFDGERNPFTLSIGDADNIDRFDAYRIYENLQYRKYDEMSIQDKQDYVNTTLERLNKYKNLEFATQTGKELWIEKLKYQIGFYEKLKEQIENSTDIK